MQVAQKHEARSEQQPAQRQGSGNKLASPRGSDIAQLEALAAASPRMAAQGAVAAQLAASPAMAEQGQRMGAIKDSARMTIQQKKALDAGEAVQRVEEEEPMQGKFDTAQLAEEEEPLQGKADAAQLVEEEEPMQGKFETAQLVEEEEPLQGKAEAAQLVEEEEPLQGKAEAAQLVEEEEPLQGKAAAAQLVEEEEPLQGKAAAAQLVEEEEPLQGKAETAQLAEEEEPLQGKFEPAQLAEEEEPLQGKAAGAPVAQREAAPENKSGLPGQLKTGIESMSGMSMDHVNVHYNSPEPAQLNAHAFAQGSDIHVAPGQEQHLPHEAWHVVQQAQGRVQATTQMKTGTPVNDDVGLETEADVMGAKAMDAGKQVQAKADAQLKEIDPGSGPAQLEGRGRSGSVSGSAPGPSAEASPSEMVTEEWTDFDDSLPEQAEAEEEELTFSPNATPEEKASISRMGPGLKMGVQSAGTVAGGVKDVASTVEDAVDPVEKGAELFASSNSVWQHIKDGAVGVVGALASPIADMISAALGMKTKWAQWKVFDDTTTEVVDGKKVPKSDAQPEAVYALTKSPAGFMKYVKDMFMGVFNFVRNLLAIIPGAQFIAGPMAVFNAVVGLVDKLYKAGKKFYQFIKGEKKETNSTSMLDKAIAGDAPTLTLLLRLKLPSICGSGIGIVDELEAKALAAKGTVKRGLFGGKKDTATRVIDLMKPGGGGPTSESELLQMLQLIKNSAASKEILRNDIKTTMTGYGV
jgi:hypothetical protein